MNPACHASWVVRPAAMIEELWLVAQDPGSSPFTIAAAEPVCPRCGRQLAAVLRLDQQPEALAGRAIGVSSSKR
jgi:hypothetical protein